MDTTIKVNWKLFLKVQIITAKRRVESSLLDFLKEVEQVVIKM